MSSVRQSWGDNKKSQASGQHSWSLRVLVTTLQLCGLFPYTWLLNTPSSRPQFAVTPCLWIVVLSAGYIFQEMYHSQAILDINVQDIGDFVFYTAGQIAASMTIFIHLSLIVNCRHLAHMLPLLKESMQEVPYKGKRIRVEIILACVCIFASLVLLRLLRFSHIITTVSTPLVLALIQIVFVLTYIYISYFPVMLYVWLLNHLGNRITYLTHAALTPTTTPSLLTAFSPTTLTAIYQEEIMIRLHHLEEDIRKVGHIFLSFLLSH